jgi:hypothetical protein
VSPRLPSSRWLLSFVGGSGGRSRALADPRVSSGEGLGTHVRMKKPAMLAAIGLAGFVIGIAGCGDDNGNGGGTTNTVNTVLPPPVGPPGVGPPPVAPPPGGPQPPVGPPPSGAGTTTDDNGGNSGRGGGGGDDDG